VIFYCVFQISNPVAGVNDCGRRIVTITMAARVEIDTVGALLEQSGQREYYYARLF